ncbi:DUF2235 domain-containing protein [Tenacibaculum finnmarkense]|uniref:phospholipase effector Tle1 domain-containing protein n=1 Tax=Tenacibaculum finnmarkense TaxID=2781243 RepID=UPI001EFC1C17|nr:DUF2235 domain-containing protein [Tenacibaculum finnmarkense]MCG8894686.1 DUF2235 domain-containing protein [Tenacibaculum finnmarkense]
MSAIAFKTFEVEEITTEEAPELIIGMFFDGTGNNRKNTRARKISKNIGDEKDRKIEEAEETEDYVKAFKKHGEDDSSYYNDESNVSRLEQYYQTEKNGDIPNTYSLYIEGIGTGSLKEDGGISGGLGKTATSDYGVGGKVEKGCRKIAKKIKEKAVKDKITDKMTIKSLTFDCYGFSRGATAARHFIYQVKRPAYILRIEIPGSGGQTYDRDMPAMGYLGEALKNEGIVVKEIHIRFVGLYDSVSSYGLYHGDDEEELKLNWLFYAAKVVHLTAQDEIRYNFDLTNIDSADPCGLTIALPGAHSDIGGGYLKSFDEKKLLWDSEETRIKLWGDMFYSVFDFIDAYNLVSYYYNLEGWFSKKQLKISKGVNRRELYSKREGLENLYSVIPLQIMANLSNEYACIDKDRLKAKFNVEGDVLLKKVQEKIETQIDQEKDVSRHITCMPFDREENIRKRWKNVVDKWQKEKNLFDLQYDRLETLLKAWDTVCMHRKFLKRICKLFNLDTVKKEIEKEYDSIKKNRFKRRFSLLDEEESKPQKPLESLYDLPGNIRPTEGYDPIMEEESKHLNEVEVIAWDSINKNLRNRFLHVSHSYVNILYRTMEGYKPRSNYERVTRNG